MLVSTEANYIFEYDNKTGKLFWKNPRSTRTKVGTEAGTKIIKSGKPIIRIYINGETYLAQEIIWLMINGTFPKFGIINIDGDFLNNRIENLKDGTPPYKYEKRNK